MIHANENLYRIYKAAAATGDESASQNAWAIYHNAPGPHHCIECDKLADLDGDEHCYTCAGKQPVLGDDDAGERHWADL